MCLVNTLVLFCTILKMFYPNYWIIPDSILIVWEYRVGSLQDCATMLSYVRWIIKPDRVKNVSFSHYAQWCS